MPSPAFVEIAQQLVETGRRLDARGWVLGTSGNFSAVVSRDPLRVAVTPSAAFKGELTTERVLEVDEGGSVVGVATGRPSAELLVHLEILGARDAGAVLHTHSVWSTVLSDEHAIDGGLWITGYEMLKGLEGVGTHEHREWLPIVENDQNMSRLARSAGETVRRHPEAHGFLIRRHGLYTWGADVPQAVRHLEILEFLLETVGRTFERRAAAARAAIETT